jgi:hypothetical protein
MTETSQAGMFALGTPSHAYLEFDAHEGAGPRLVTAIASLHEPRTTMGGVTSSPAASAQRACTRSCRTSE